MSVYYLNTSTQMKIRPVSDEDVLFEMETNEFITTCCRVNTSYDLVVRDITSGAMLFCISGAEIEDHPLDVYISDDHHIGRIEGMDIYVHGQNSHTVRIQKQTCVYIIKESTVTITAGLVTINWSQGLSKELKALSIGFALNIAMTKLKSTVIDGAVIRSTTPVDVKYPSLLPSSQSEACPRNNRLNIQPIFESSEYETDYWMTGAGWLLTHKSPGAFLIDHYTQRVVTILKSTLNTSTKFTNLVGLNSNGEEEFTAFRRPLKNKSLITVTSQDHDIGQITVDSKSGVYTLQYYSNGSTYNISTKAVKIFGVATTTFVDDGGKKYGKFNDDLFTALNITLSAHTTPTLMKLIISTAFFHCQQRLFIFADFPWTTISRLICNCDYCQKPVNTQRQCIQEIKEFFMNENLTIKAIGHNKRKNLTYFNICTHGARNAFCTLEVTPIEYFQGVAKLEGRDKNCSLLFTSFHYEQHEIFAIYDSDGRLTAYIVGSNIFSETQNHIFTIKKCEKRKIHNEERFAPNIEHFVIDRSGAILTKICACSCHMEIFRPRRSLRVPTPMEVFIELTLAVSLNSNPYRNDRIPTPEIVYCYKKTKNMNIKEF